MKKCVIFCASELNGPVCPVGPEDLVIAADGGLRHTQALGLEPQVILGDFDSLGYVPGNARVFPKEKDDTDSMLAIRLGLEKGYREFVLYGAMDGPRVDHTLANFQALQFLAREGARGWLVGRHQIATAFENSLTLPSSFRGIFSLFSLGKDVNATVSGGKYSVKDTSLFSWFPLGVSNEFVGNDVVISCRGGILTLVYDRKNGILEEKA